MTTKKKNPRTYAYTNSDQEPRYLDLFLKDIPRDNWFIELAPSTDWREFKDMLSFLKEGDTVEMANLNAFGAINRTLLADFIQDLILKKVTLKLHARTLRFGVDAGTYDPSVLWDHLQSIPPEYEKHEYMALYNANRILNENYDQLNTVHKRLRKEHEDLKLDYKGLDIDFKRISKELQESVQEFIKVVPESNSSNSDQARFHREALQIKYPRFFNIMALLNVLALAFLFISSIK